MKSSPVAALIAALLLAGCSSIGSANGGRQDDESTGLPDRAAGAPRSTPVPIDEEIVCDYFVAPQGDDAAPGGESQPWASFQHAADSVQAGDTVCFRAGTYAVEQAISISGSGTPEAPVAYVAYQNERPVLDGGGEAGGLVVLEQGASHLRIGGFTLLNFTDWGVDLEGGNHHVRLDHLNLEGGEAGVHFTYGDDDLAPPAGGAVDHITLEDSVISKSAYTAVDCTPGPCNDMVFRQLEVFGSGIGGEASFGADGLAVSRGYRVLVEDCYIHDNGGDGIDLNSRDRDGHASGVIVRRNRVERNYQNGIKLWAGGRLENNAVWGQGNSALWLGTFHGQFELINNTVGFNMWDPSYSGRNWAIAVGYPEDIVALPQVELLMVNNVIAFNTGPEVGSATGLYLGPGVRLTEHHNLYFSQEDGEMVAEFLDWEVTRQELSGGGWTDRTGQGQHDVTQDPRFRSGWPSVDLSLQSTSPAIDAGDGAVCPTEDLYGHLRPADGNLDGNAVCDLGAIEAGS